jgi:integrase
MRVTVRPKIQKRKTGAGARHVVRWQGAGVSDRSRSFPTLEGARVFQADLVRAAARHDTEWDHRTGLPQALAAPAGKQTWFEFAIAYSHRQVWRPQSRKSAVEGLSIATLVFMKTGRSSLTVAEVRAIREYLLDAFVPSRRFEAAADRHKNARDLLEKKSLPLRDIDLVHVDQLRSAMRHELHKATRLAGQKGPFDPDAPAELSGPNEVVGSTFARRHSAVHGVFDDAVRRGLIAANPLDKVKRDKSERRGARTRPVSRTMVATPGEVECLAAAVAIMGRGSGRYYALILLLGLAGLRPSEAYNLRVADVSLPATDDEWGEVTVRGGTTSPGRRYTGGEAWSDEAIKTTSDQKQTRQVPIPPRVVMALRLHLEFFTNGRHNVRVFTNTVGLPVNPNNLERLWRQVRVVVFPIGNPLRNMRLYDLRHACATLLLASGVPIPEVARRLGHGPDVLMRIYAGVFTEERELSNQRVDDYLKLAAAG